ncbi:MAG: UbiX family flavin prenyltransferase [Bacteroidota bacterium]
MNKQKIVVGITGASGAIYAQVLLGKLAQLSSQIAEVGVVMSDNAKEVWKFELGNTDYEKTPFRIYGKNDFMAPFASGSARFSTMIICPCSMGTMARIASGISSDLMTRAADVMLKERRRLILIPRDTPLSLIHINSMKTVTEAGGIILPASPSFYSRPRDIESLVATVIDRALDMAGLEISSFRWNDK